MSNYSPSNIKSRLTALKVRHILTSQKIKSESNRPNPDGLLLQGLKRKRLKLKDEIAEYSFI